MRVALQVEYNGWGYRGFQAQHGLTTIQDSLEKAISTVANEPINVFCAGRTDAQVHAYGQIVHFDTKASRPIHAWVRGVNRNLPEDIVIKSAHVVDEAFHARFSALSRRYRYVIYQHSLKSAMIQKRATWCYLPLDSEKMQLAVTHLLGEHDFSSFRSSQCMSQSAMRNVMAVSIIKKGNFILFEIEANAFLHHMVRNIVGSLLWVGLGKKEPIWFSELLAAKDRRLAAETAPPEGLYLLSVRYPENYSFPQLDSDFILF